MALTFDPSGDFVQVADGTEAVTLNRRGTSTSTSISEALRRAITTSEISASNGQYISSDTVWHLSIDEVTTRPRLGDTITDSGSQIWTVIDVRKETLSERWRCVSRDLAIEYGLDDFVDIQLAVYAKGDAGTAESTWHDEYTGVRARIQQESTELIQGGDAETTATRYTIFIAKDMTLTNKHRITGPDDTIYWVTGFTKVGVVGELMEVETEVRPWQLS